MYPQERDGSAKLRLLYEVNPLGWLVERAGGRVSEGAQSPLERSVEHMHQRVAVILGSRDEVARVEAYHR